MIVVVEGVLTSLPLEDAAVTAVEFCCTSAVTPLPFTGWLTFLWVI